MEEKECERQWTSLTRGDELVGRERGRRYRGAI